MVFIHVLVSYIIFVHFLFIVNSFFVQDIAFEQRTDAW
jgi:hypothetical protein